jgi:hypothetical protein
MNPNENQHSVRRIVLPSGRSIEVVRFHEDEQLDRSRGLHVCPKCDSDLVHPIAWGAVSQSHWELTLHCPNCDWLCEGVFAQGEVARLEEALDEGLEAILGDLKRLADANMADEVERFAAALEADLILPEDF